MILIMPHAAAGRAPEFIEGVSDLDDDDFHPEGGIDDNQPGYRKLMVSSDEDNDDGDD